MESIPGESPDSHVLHLPASCPPTSSILQGLQLLGKDVTTVVSLVSICSILVVALVLVTPLSSSEVFEEAMQYVAGSYYVEDETDAFIDRFNGSVINAVLFTLFFTIVTSVLFFLFKNDYTSWIWVYTGFSVFVLLFFIGQLVIMPFFQDSYWKFDVVSVSVLLWNFSMVGMSSFFLPSPHTLKQGYLLVIAAFIAYCLACLPEWTTWSLLVAVGVNDVISTFTSSGPLQWISDEAKLRGVEPPSNILSVGPPPEPPAPQNPPAHAPLTPLPQDVFSSSYSGSSPHHHFRAGGRGATLDHDPLGGGRGQQRVLLLQDQHGRTGRRGSLPLEHLEFPLNVDTSNRRRTVDGSFRSINPETGNAAGAGRRSATINSYNHSISLESSRRSSNESHRSSLRDWLLQPSDHLSSEINTIREDSISTSRSRSDTSRHGNRTSLDEFLMAAGETYGQDNAPKIKLGLGDIILYGVLVGRAARHDLMTAVSCYLAILAGLGITMYMVTVREMALPPVPLSIILGFLSFLFIKFIVEVMVVGMSTNMINI